MCDNFHRVTRDRGGSVELEEELNSVETGMKSLKGVDCGTAFIKKQREQEGLACSH